MAFWVLLEARWEETNQSVSYLYKHEITITETVTSRKLEHFRDEKT